MRETTVSRENAAVVAFKDSLIGLVAGGMAGFSNFPFESLKKRRQAGLLQTREQFLFAILPKELFRGALSFTGSVASVSAVQIALDGWFKHLLEAHDQQGQLAKTAAAVVAGSLGAVMSTASEACIYNQQNLRNKFPQRGAPLDAIRFMVMEKPGASSLSVPWIGLQCLAIRELIFGYSMLEGADRVSTAARNFYLQQMALSPSKDRWAGTVGFLAEIGFGVGMAMISHPFDTITTKMQGKVHQALLEGQKPQVSAWQVAKEILKTEGEGLPAFWRGAPWRCCLFTGCMIVASEGRKMLQRLDPNRMEDDEQGLSKTI